MACECAWTRRYLADGVTKPMCCENGNFKGYQCQVGQRNDKKRLYNVGRPLSRDVLFC